MAEVSRIIAVHKDVPMCPSRDLQEAVSEIAVDSVQRSWETDPTVDLDTLLTRPLYRELERP